MTNLTKLSLGLFIASLPACYFTVAPAFLTLALYVVVMSKEEFKEMESKLEKKGPAPDSDLVLYTNKTAQLVEQFNELKTQVNAISLSMGMKPRP